MDMLVADTSRMMGPEFDVYAELVCREASSGVGFTFSFIYPLLF